MTITLSSSGDYVPPLTGKLDRDYISWHGGPAVLLQESAATQWQGATDFDNSLMNGGDIETDYDIACDAEEWCIVR